MKRRLTSLVLLLALIGTLAAGCGPAATPLPANTPGPAASDELPAPTPADLAVQGAPDALEAALAFLQGQTAGQAPAAGLHWAEENITPEELLGYSTFRYTAGDWVAKVGFPIVLPANTVYDVELSNPATRFQWQGKVDAAGKVQELAIQPTPAAPESDQAALVQGNNDFAFDLYQALRGGDGSLFFSPYSISAALAMTYAGARGQTEQEMAATLRFLLGQDRLHPAFGALAELLTGRGQGAAGKDGQGFRLHIVNALWGQEGYGFLPEFLSLLAASYGAGLEALDFTGDPEGARRAINDWVSDQTEGRIEDLIARGLITPLTRLVLTNAVYFNAAWQHPFVEANTADGPFYRLDGQQATVPMMHQVQSFGYADGPGYQLVDLPYDGGELSMAILLPAEGQFEAFEGGLSAEQVTAMLAQLEGRRVRLTMPKFEVRVEFSLGDTLAAMGMPTAFSDDADFSGMTGTPDLFISAVVHQAFVAVDEAGTEAAAATAVIMEKLSMPVEEPPVEVTVDRPFLFLIRDRETGTILFLGRVLDPT